MVLTSGFPRAAPPPGFVGRLYAPQAAALGAMLELERSGRPGPTIRTSAGVLLEEPSFGKTVCCLALAATGPPPARPPTAHQVCPPELKRGEIADVAAVHCDSGQIPGAPHAFDGCVWQFVNLHCRASNDHLPRLYATPSRFIPATVVVAGGSVITQWEAAVRQFTPGLSSFTIGNVQDLRLFQALHEGGYSTQYDIVLVKMGNVTGSFVVPGETHNGSPRAITHALARVTEGCVWGRTVWDDFDTAHPGSNDRVLPSLFTWLVSATRNVRRTCLPPANTTSPELYLRDAASFPVVQRAALDSLLWTDCLVRCDPEFTAEHISTTRVAYRRLVVEGGGAGLIMQMLGAHPQLVEMVNSGALRTAGESLGVRCSTEGALIRVLLHRHWSGLRAAARVERAVDAALRAADGAPAGAALCREVDEACSAARRGDAAGAAAALAGRRLSPEQGAQLLGLRAAAQEKQQAHRQPLERLRSNLSEGACQVCLLELDEAQEGMWLTPCCQTVLCTDCVTPPPGRCPHCAAELERGGLLNVGTDILAEGLDDESLAGELRLQEEEPDAPAPCEVQDPKVRALIALLAGEQPECVEDGEGREIEGLIEGRRDCPLPPDAPRRFLVFAQHAESTSAISAALEAHGVPHARLNGSRAEKDRRVDEFREGRCRVLIVTAGKYCAGLHLPEATDVVFFHHLCNPAVRNQVAGRAQRTGRTHNLTVTYIYNQGDILLEDGEA